MSPPSLPLQASAMRGRGPRTCTMTSGGNWQVPGTSSAYAERVQNGYYLEITPDRPALARYGLTVGDLQETIATALGGETVTTTVEGRERYTVNVRYLRDLRNDPQAIASQVLVQSMGGPAVPLGQVASVQ